MELTTQQREILLEIWITEERFSSKSSIIRRLISEWESIRPQDDASKELAQAKVDIAELNQRLHERTQAFLSKAPPPEPKPTPEEIERREFEEWADSGNVIYIPEIRSFMWTSWQAARTK